MTVCQLLSWSKATFPAIEGLDFTILLGHVLQVDPALLIAKGDKKLPHEKINRYKILISRRQRGFPIAYLTGVREFWSLPLAVKSGVLIPRHETELVVERVLALLENKPNARLLELGTGSGAIALALASELPQCPILATDKSGSALAVANLNRSQLGINNVDFIKSDWYKSIGNKKFDLICSNPPYVSPRDKHLLEGDVRFEPQIALVAKDDGFAELYHIITHGFQYLSPQGWLVLEHGYQQAQDVKHLLDKTGFTNVVTYQDLSKNDRVTEAQLL